LLASGVLTGTLAAEPTQIAPTTTGSAPAAAATTAAGPTTTATVTVGAGGAEEIARLNARIDDLHQEIDDLRSFFSLWMIPVTILVAFVTGGVGFSIWSSFRAETRQTQLHELGVAGETAAQARAEQVHATFLESSQKTLGLVNDTLALAKQAQDRAAEVSERRARASLAQVDDRAQQLVHDALVKPTLKAIVEDPTLRAELSEVASEVSLVEASLLHQEIPLTPACLFVKGMERHLRPITEPGPAIRHLVAAAREAHDQEFAALAYYWAGYLSNNIGEFSAALDKFRRALESLGNEDDKRSFELQRLGLETEFFQIAHDAGERAVTDVKARRDLVRGVTQRLTTLLKSVQRTHPNLKSEASAISRTSGNVLFWVADPASLLMPHRVEDGRDPAEQIDALTLALERYDAASGVWATFGGLQTRRALAAARTAGQDEGVFKEAIATLDDKEDVEVVLHEVLKELRNRTEQRTHAQLYQTFLMARFWRGDAAERDVDDAYAEVQSSLRPVHDPMTIFSQFSKTNVSRTQFERETDQFHLEAHDVVSQRST
jgi:tetratricopeptide (TPR) repeat protein